MQKISQCVNKLETLMVCIDAKCKQMNPFICSGSSCPGNKCKNIHRRCSKNQWSIFKQILYEQNNQTHQLSNKVSNIVEELIYNSIKLLYSELDQLKKWRQLSTNNKNIKQLFQDIEKNNEAGWNGSRLTTLLNKLQLENKEAKIINQIKIEKDRKLLLEKLQDSQKWTNIENHKNKKKKQSNKEEQINPNGQWNAYLFDIKNLRMLMSFEIGLKQLTLKQISTIVT